MNYTPETKNYHFDFSNLFGFSSTGFEVFTVEKLIESKPKLLSYLERISPTKAEEIQRYFKIFGIPQKYWDLFQVDFTLLFNGNSNVGGYYSLTDKDISINPMILQNGSINEIMHVIYHESLHAGFVERVEGINLMDEGLVETLTIMKMEKVFGKTDFQSAYVPIVKQLEQYFEDFSDEDIMNHLSAEDQNTLDGIIKLVVLNPLMEKIKDGSLKWHKIKNELQTKWDFLKKYFNRLINSVDNRNVMPDEEAKMNVGNYKFENLLINSVLEIFEQNLIFQIFEEAFENLILEGYTDDELIKVLYEKGYGYLIDYSVGFEFNKKKVKGFPEETIKKFESFSSSFDIALGIYRASKSEPEDQDQNEKRKPTTPIRFTQDYSKVKKSFSSAGFLNVA